MSGPNMFDFCYNHDNLSAVFRCFDCKEASARNAMNRSIPYKFFSFTKHKPLKKYWTVYCILKEMGSDQLGLVSVKTDTLNDVLTTLQYTEQQEKEMLREFITKTEKRILDIWHCHDKVDKAIQYLNKVLSAIKSCSPHDLVQDISTSNLSNNDLNPAGDGEQHQTPEGSFFEEFPVSVTSSLNKKGVFWMVRSDSTGLKKVAHIENKLRDHFTSSVCACATDIKEGTICIASNPTRTEFWRVIVEKLCQDELVAVKYLDHGQQESIPISCIFQMPLELKQIPYQAMECCLFPYSEKVSLPYEAKWCFKDLVHGKDIKAQISSKVIFPEGNALYHVQLTSLGPPPLNINQKVTDLLQEQKLDKEDRPILPKEEAADQVQQAEEHRTLTSQEGKSLIPAEQMNVALATAELCDDQSREQSVAFDSNQAVHVPQNEENEKPPVDTILPKDTAEQRSSLESSKNPCKIIKDTKEPLREVKTWATALEYVPIGFLNEQMYDRILKECKANFTHIKSFLTYARFFVLQADDFQLVEAMKTKIWCCIDEILCKNINRAFKDQVSRGSKNAVFLVFLTKFCIVGLARLISQCQTNPSCSVVGRGLLWSHCCHGEFCIELFNAYKFPTKLLDSEAYVRQILRDNLPGREINWEKGFDIIKKYEKNKRKISVLDDKFMYRKDLRKDLRKDFVSRRENMSEEEQKSVITGQRKVEDVEVKLLYRNVNETQNGLRRKSIEDGGQFLGVSRKDEKEHDWTKSEDWDLEAEPIRVAKIYGNISSPTASQRSTSENGAVEEQNVMLTREEKLEELTLNSSESALTTPCSVIVDDSSSNFQTELKESEESNYDHGAVSFETQTNEAVSKLNENSVEKIQETESTQDDSPLELKSDVSIAGFNDEKFEATLTVTTATTTTINPMHKLELKIEAKKEDQADVDLVLGEEGFSAFKDRPKYGGDQNSTLGGGVASNLEEAATFEPSEEGLEVVTVLEGPQEESSITPSEFESHKKSEDKAVEKGSGMTDSVPEKRGELLDEKSIGSSQYIYVEDDTRARLFPQLRNHPNFEQMLQPSESQSEKTDFYFVNPPPGSHEASACFTLGETPVTFDCAEGSDAKGKSEEGTAVKQDTLGKVDDETVSTTEGSSASRDVGLMENWRASHETIDDPDDTVSTSCYLSKIDADVVCEKESSDNEEAMAFLPVEPGYEYRVTMMSEPNEDQMFWAKLCRSVEEERSFKQFITRLNNEMKRRNEKLSNPFVMKNCCLKSKLSGSYRRVLIKKMLSKGKVLVHNVDYGFTNEVHIDELREADDEFQLAYPPQAVECRILNSINEKYKAMFSELSFKHNKRNYEVELDIYVRAISGETAEVDVLRAYQMNY